MSLPMSDNPVSGPLRLLQMLCRNPFPPFNCNPFIVAWLMLRGVRKPVPTTRFLKCSRTYNDHKYHWTWSKGSRCVAKVKGQGVVWLWHCGARNHIPAPIKGTTEQRKTIRMSVTLHSDFYVSGTGECANMGVKSRLRLRESGEQCYEMGSFIRALKL
jgi:hypothetical protein